MTGGWERYLAAVAPDPAYAACLLAGSAVHEQVLVVGYHAAFATHPGPGTPLATFDALVSERSRRADGIALMGLVRIEHTTEYSVVTPDGSLRTEWRATMFDCLPRGVTWLLQPAELNPDTGRPRTAPGPWAASGYRAQLPPAVTDQILGAPAVVKVHDQNPHTGRRWLRSR